MKRFLILMAVIAFVPSGLAFGNAAADALPSVSTEAAAPAVRIREVRPGVWIHTSYHTFPGGVRVPSNGLIVRDGDGLLLVDTAWGELQTARLLRKIKREIRLPVRRAVITHSHADRIAGVDVLEKSGVTVFASKMTRRLAMRQGEPVPGHTLAGLSAPGAAVRLGPVEIFYPGPGHAPDNLMVWVPAQRVLFGGCAIRAGAAKSLGNTADANLASWQQAVNFALQSYPEAQVVVPGHGDAGGPELLRHTLSLFAN